MSVLVERAEQVRAIMSRLFSRKVWCAVIAPEYSGKTVIAGQLRDAIEGERPAWRVTRVEFHSAATLEAAWNQVAIHLNADKTRSEAIWVQPVADSLDQILTKDATQRHCLILDNVDALPDEVLRLLGGELRRFLNEQRFQEARERLRCVLLGAMKLRYLASGEYSPLFNLLQVIELPDLTEQQAADLLSARLGDVKISRASRQELFRQTAGHPYLVKTIAETMADNTALINERIADAAEAWQYKDDKCFTQAVKYVESDRRAFDVVLRLLNNEKPAPKVLGSDDTAQMCGAIIEHRGSFTFRGHMFRRALTEFMDDLRKADYCCLHGDWERGRSYYAKVPRRDVQKRRKTGLGLSKRRIMDLYLYLTPVFSQQSRLGDVERLIAETSCRFFGASQAVLWSLESDTKDAKVAFTTEDTLFPPDTSKDVASAAARNHACFTLSRNAGIVQGIGVDPTTTRWALELRYEEGLPGEWVRDSLQYIEPSLHSILSQAHGRELEDKRLSEQRRLIHEISLTLQRATEVNRVFGLIVDGVRDRLGYECAQLSLVFWDEGVIRPVRNNGVFEFRAKYALPQLKKRPLSGNDVLAIVVREKRHVIIPDCTAENAPVDPDAIKELGLKSQVVVPLLLGDEAIGALQAGDTKRSDAFQEADAELLRLLADQAAMAIQMAKEREALERALEAAGDAMVVVDASERVVSVNPAYFSMFHVKPGDKAPLSRPASAPAPESKSLVRIAFEREEALQTLREMDGRKYIVTAAGLKDSFGGYAGGVEVIAQNILYGLTAALSEMLVMRREEEVGQAIVTCLCEQLGYKRARFYRLSEDGNRLVSSWSFGMGRKRAERLENGEFSFEQSDNADPSDGFACMRQDAAVIVMRSEVADKTFPRGKVFDDPQHRRVLVLPDNKAKYTIALGLEDVKECLEVPLRHVGKVVLDLKGTSARFGLEHLELMALFSRWATAAMERVIELERARSEAEVVRDVRHLTEKHGLETLMQDFLLEICIPGGLEFNRAVLFLRQPHSELIGGALLYGAATKEERDQQTQVSVHPGNRQELIHGIRKQKWGTEKSEKEKERTEKLRRMIQGTGDSANPFSIVLNTRETFFVDKASSALSTFYRSLEWEPAPKAMICPLIFAGECEGLIYVDRAFMGSVSESDREHLEALLVHPAAVAHHHRVSEELRRRVLGLTHASVAPISIANVLAQSLRQLIIDTEQLELLDLIVSESRRGVDMVRRVHRVAQLSSTGLEVKQQRGELDELLRDRARAYKPLFKADGFKLELEMPDERMVANIDGELIGEAFGELIENARRALVTSREELNKKSLKICCQRLRKPKSFEIVFENPSAPLPQDARKRIFELYYSYGGGTGLGLWIVREAIKAHKGTIHYEHRRGVTRFVIRLPDTDLPKAKEKIS